MGRQGDTENKRDGERARMRQRKKIGRARESQRDRGKERIKGVGETLKKEEDRKFKKGRRNEKKILFLGGGAKDRQTERD